MTKVIKKDGRRQTFSGAKLKRSVEKAAKEAKLKPAQRKELIKEVANPLIKLVKKKRVVKATALRTSMLGRISRKAKKAATAWKRYDKKKRKKKAKAAKKTTKRKTTRRKTAKRKRR